MGYIDTYNKKNGITKTTPTKKQIQMSNVDPTNTDRIDQTHLEGMRHFCFSRNVHWVPDKTLCPG